MRSACMLMELCWPRLAARGACADLRLRWHLALGNVASSSEDDSQGVSQYVAYVREVFVGKRGADPELSVFWRVPEAPAKTHRPLRRLRHVRGALTRARAGCTGRTKPRASQAPP